MALEHPDSHAPGIHRHDLVVKAGKPGLIALDHLGSTSLPIAGNADVDLRCFHQELLSRIAVAAVARPFRGFIVR